MRLRRAFLLSVTAACLAMVLPAEAAPRFERTYTAPFAHSEGYRWDECVKGATCTPVGSARPNGAAAASIRYDRTPATRLDEFTGAGGRYHQYALLPRGARSATVTLRWRVSSASTTTTATEGAIYAATEVASQVRCLPDCGKTTSFRTITRACARSVSPWCSSALFGATGTSTTSPVDVDLVMDLADVGGSMLSIFTTAGGFVVGAADCATYISGNCTPLVPAHRGSARATITAQLRSIRVTAS